MRVNQKSLWNVIVAGVMAAPLSVFATNGYFDIGYGAGAHGTGGAQAALPQDSLVQANNPAGIIDLETRFDIGGALFIPMRRSNLADTTVGDGGGWSGVNNFMVPSMGGVLKSSKDMAYGFAMYGNGFKVLYNPNFLTLGNTNIAKENPEINLDLIQVFLQMSAAKRITDNNTLGFAVVGGRQRFGIKGLAAFDLINYSAYPGSVTDRQFDYANGSGWRIGWMGTSPSKTFTWGASYASKVRMGKFEKYKGLFAEQGGFDVPSNYIAGIAVKATPSITVAFDVEHILYSDVPSVGNRGPVPGGDLPLELPTGDTRLGTKNGSGFGWTDGTYYKLGVRYELAPGVIFRGGYNIGKTTIPDDQLTFNMLAPATVEQHYTLGMTYGLGRTPIFGIGKESALSFSYVHAFRKKQEGPTLAGTGLIEMFQDVFEGALNITF